MNLVVLVHFGSLGVLWSRVKTQYQTQKVIFFKVLNAKKKLHFFVHCLPKIAHMWTQLHVKISRTNQAIGGAH